MSSTTPRSSIASVDYMHDYSEMSIQPDLDTKKERCHPTVWVDPTPEELQESVRICGEHMKERDARWAAVSGDFEGWVQNEINTGHTLQIEPSLGSHEPPRLNRVEHWVKHQVSKSQKKIFPGFELNPLRTRNTRVGERNPLLSTKISTVGSTTFVDKNGELLLHIQENGAREAYQGMPEADILLSKVGAAYDKLQSVFPAEQRQAKDPRHPGHDPYHKAQEKYHKRNNFPYGVFHDGVWHQQGHGMDQTSYDGGPWCHIRTEDSCGGIEKSEVKEKAMAEFRAAVVGAEVSAGMILKALDPEYFAAASAHLDTFVEEGLTVRHSPWQWSLLLGMPVNKAVEAHKDQGDAKEAIVVTMPIGRFSGGDFCVPALNIRLRVLEGDVVFLKAALLEHAVTQFRGSRLCLVFTSKSDKNSARQHVNYMTDPAEIKAVWAQRHSVIARKDAKFAVQAAKEAALIRDWLANKPLDYENFPSVDDYKLLHVSDRPRRLKVASARKQFAIRALERKESTPELVTEIERLKRRPASLFYNLFPLEKHRASQGRNPFQLTSPITRAENTDKESRGPWHQRGGCKSLLEDDGDEGEGMDES